MTEDSLRVALGIRLREAREYVGLSQEEVADHLGLPRPAVSQIERGRRRVEALELSRLAALYQRPVSFFTSVPDNEGQDAEVEILKRATTGLSDTDKAELLRFAEFLRGRAGKGAGDSGGRT